MCTNAISLMTKGIICCGETIQRFILPLNLHLIKAKITLNNLDINPKRINIASIENTLNIQFKDFKLNLKKKNFKILSITC